MSHEDIPETSKRLVRVLFGNHVDTISKVYAKGIERGLNHKYAFSFKFCSTNDEILECSCEDGWNVFILVLNNIITSPRMLEPEKRKDAVVDLVRSLKAMCHTTVIALWGWNFEDPQIEEEVRAAGADFCFPIPVDVKVLVEAVEMCLY